MRKLFFNLVLSCSVGISVAQTPLESSTFIPKITQPTPEAFSFTRYGDLPVGLFTGSMNYSIPFFQIQSGKLSLPVSLDYATNGIKVDAVSARTGMDWNLRAGGVITCNIFGKSDCTAALIAPPADSSSQEFYTHVKYVGDNFVNTQPDEFTYNFMGYSGKFYFDYSGNAKQLTPAGLKITSNSAHSYIQIVAPDGTLYYFSSGDVNFTYSLFGDNNGTEGQYGGITAWYLTKMKNVYGDSVMFTYGGTGYIDYISGVSQTFKEGAAHAYDGAYMMGSNYAGGFGEMRYTSGAQFYGCPLNSGLNTDVRFTDMYAMFLTEINFKQGKLKLYYSNRDDLPGELKLDSIDLFSAPSNTRIKSIGFKYIYSQAGSTYNTIGYLSPVGTPLPVTYPYLQKRLFLDTVKIFNATKTDSLSWAFEYDSVNNLPPRLSYSQDVYGYFNGKMNTNFLPDNTLFSHRAGFSTFPLSRGIDSAFGKKGVLKKMTYPTGGFSKIFYEANQLGGGNYIRYQEDFDTVINTINYSGTNTVTYSSTFTLNYAYQVILTAEPTGPSDPMAPQLDSNVTFSIEDLTDNSCLVCNVNINPREYIEIFDALASLQRGDNYRLKLETQNPGMRARVQFIHYNYITDTSHSQVVSSGFRVASIRNYSSDSILTGVKKFNYNDSNGVSTGGSVLYYSDSRDFCYIERMTCNVGTPYIGSQNVITSSSIIGGYTNDYAAVTYKHVTEYFDSSGVGGSISTDFQIGQNKLPTVFAINLPFNVYDYSPFLIQGAPLINTGYMTGKELKKTFYKYAGGTYHKIKEINTYYSTDSRLYNVDSFYAIRKAITRDTYGAYKYFADFDINEYKKITAWVHVDSTVQKEIDDGGHIATLKTMYVYGNPSHQLATEVKYVTSKGDTSKKITKYPDDLRLLDLGNTVLINLCANNIINVPLVNQQYSNSTLLSTAQIEYNSSLLPATLKTSTRSAALELDAEYTKYDALGNPREFKVKGQPNALLVDTSDGNVVAGCANCEFDHIAYTSFETGYAGNWSGLGLIYFQNNDAITGSRYYQQTGFSFSKSALSSSTFYIVSYWSKSGSYTVSGTQSGYPKTVRSITIGSNTWTLYEHLVTGQTTVTVSGTGAIDELRLYPKQAQMTTYTYQPLKGITSQCDINNRVMYYEYDDFARLKLIRDQDRNILKTYEYQYKKAF